MSKIKEEWRPVKDYEGLYEVSDWGNVRSLDRYNTQKNRLGHYITRVYHGRILKKPFDDDGYMIVSLSKQGEKERCKRVNRLVAEAFLPNPENKPDVGHTKTLSNGLEDKTANEAWNLQWMTYEENANYGTILERKSNRMKKDYEDGKRKKVWEGKKRPDHSKIMSIPIIEIREDGSIIEWESTTEYCRETGINAPRVTLAVNGKNRNKGHHYRTSQFFKKDEYEKMLGNS